MESALTVFVIVGLIVVVAMFVFSRWLFKVTYRLTRERTFRSTLRRWGYSDRAIDKAVEEQGW